MVDKIVNDVVESIKEENDIIDKNLSNIDIMENSIVAIGGGIKQILSKIDKLVNCNELIDKYALELDDSSKNVTTITEEVVVYNKDNKENVLNVKEYINNLSKITEKLNACI
jgi:methyl-accepting chemotaxis protein